MSDREGQAMHKYRVLVQMTKKVGSAQRWVHVQAENARDAMRLAEANVMSPHSMVVKAQAVQVQVSK